MNAARRPSFLALLLAGTLALPPWAGAEEKPVPKPPFVTPVPASGHWTITVHQSPAAPPAATPAPATPQPEPVTVLDVVKTGSTRRFVLTAPGNPVETFDEQEGYVMSMTPFGPNIFRIGTPDALPPLCTDGFPLTEWVGPAGLGAFKGVEKMDGAPCFHYQQDAQDAWVDVTTLLPVAATRNGVRVEYKFLAPPEAPLAFPAQEIDGLRKVQAANKTFQSLR